MGFQLNLCFSLFLLFIVFLFQTKSIPIYSDEIVRRQIALVKEVAKTPNYRTLLTLVSQSIFDLENAEDVRKALETVHLRVIHAKFEHPGIHATVLEGGIHLSNMTMRRHKRSSTGWIIVRAGFLECLLNNDSESFCIED